MHSMTDILDVARVHWDKHARGRTLVDMESLADLLAKRKKDEPADIGVIKTYVQEQFNERVGVAIRERDILITVRSSAVAGALRMRMRDISERLENSEKRLVFRVGTL